MFQLTATEYEALRSQIATSKTTFSGRGGRRYLPYVFTEYGAMLSAIRQLMSQPTPKRRGIGFTAVIDEKK
jgi:hypothetical protein